MYRYLHIYTYDLSGKIHKKLLKCYDCIEKEAMHSWGKGNKGRTIFHCIKLYLLNYGPC